MVPAIFNERAGRVWHRHTRPGNVEHKVVALVDELEATGYFVLSGVIIIGLVMRTESRQLFTGDDERWPNLEDVGIRVQSLAFNLRGGGKSFDELSQSLKTHVASEGGNQRAGDSIDITHGFCDLDVAPGVGGRHPSGNGTRSL